MLLDLLGEKVVRSCQDEKASTTSWIVMWVFLNFENGLVEFWWWFRHDVEYFALLVTYVFYYCWFCMVLLMLMLQGSIHWELMVLQISYHVRPGSGYESCCLLEVPWFLGPNFIKDWFGSLVGLLWVYSGFTIGKMQGKLFPKFGDIIWRSPGLKKTLTFNNETKRVTKNVNLSSWRQQHLQLIHFFCDFPLCFWVPPVVGPRYSLRAFERLLPSLTMNAIVAVHDTGLHVGTSQRGCCFFLGGLVCFFCRRLKLGNPDIIYIYIQK